MDMNARQTTMHIEMEGTRVGRTWGSLGSNLPVTTTEESETSNNNRQQQQGKLPNNKNVLLDRLNKQWYNSELRSDNERICGFAATAKWKLLKPIEEHRTRQHSWDASCTNNPRRRRPTKAHDDNNKSTNHDTTTTQEQHGQQVGTTMGQGGMYPDFKPRSTLPCTFFKG